MSLHELPYQKQFLNFLSVAYVYPLLKKISVL